MIWQPQGDREGFSFPLGIWTDTEIAGGGQPTSFYYTQKGMSDCFGEGTKTLKSRLSRDNVISVLASDSDIVLVNQMEEQVIVTIDNYANQIVLSPYEVRFLHDVAIITQDNITLASSENSLKSIDYHLFPNPVTGELTISLDWVHNFGSFL